MALRQTPTLKTPHISPQKQALISLALAIRISEVLKHSLIVKIAELDAYGVLYSRYF